MKTAAQKPKKAPAEKKPAARKFSPEVLEIEKIAARIRKAWKNANISPA